MKGSLKLASVAGIGIFVHWTFSLLVIWVVALVLLQGGDLGDIAFGLTLVSGVFACVVLHELGHALTAKRYGISTRDITLLPIGGLARLQRIPDDPRQEFWIAVMGPAVNVVIAAVLLLFIAAFSSLRPITELQILGGHMPSTLFWLNVILVFFNLLPAFPMDGGRVLRAVLAMYMDYVRATQIASNVGQTMAIFFGLFALLTFNLILAIIAVFIYLGAQQEGHHAMMRSVIQGVPVRQAMITRFRTLSPDDTLDVAIQELLSGHDENFLVVEDSRLAGILTRKELVSTLAEQGRNARVGDIMRPNCVSIEDSAMLYEAFIKMQENACPMVPVVDRYGELVGVLTLENVGELMMIASALRKSGARSERSAVFSAHNE